MDEYGSVLEILQDLVAHFDRDVVLLAVWLPVDQVVGTHLDKEATRALAGLGNFSSHVSYVTCCWLY